jgi:hypothetical protein
MTKLSRAELTISRSLRALAIAQEQSHRPSRSTRSFLVRSGHVSSCKPGAGAAEPGQDRPRQHGAAAIWCRASPRVDQGIILVSASRKRSTSGRRPVKILHW